MSPCVYHPAIPAGAACVQCRRALCANCAVQFQGGSHCVECRNRRLAELQGAAKPVYTPARRQQTALTAAGLLIAVLLGPMFLGMLLAVALGQIWPSVAWVPGLGGFVVGIAGAVLLGTPLSQLGSEKLQEDVTRKLRAQGVPAMVIEQGVFVGIAPGEVLKTYHGDLHWDIGYLAMGPGWAAYYGDQTHFSLRPDQIRELELLPKKGSGNMVPSRLLLRWRDERAGLSGVMNVMATRIRSRKEAHQQLDALRGRFEAWTREAPAAPVNAGWPLPPVTAPRGQGATVPTAGEPGGLARWLLVAVALAVAGGLLMAGLQIFLGVNIPSYAMIGVLVVAAQSIATKWNQSIAEKRAREREQSAGGTGAGTDAGAGTLRT